MLAIQRLFLIDTNALEASFKLIEKTKPDYIEVMPGILPPHIIQEVTQHTGISILAGGLIRTKEDIEFALQAGAIAVTTSNPQLWEKYLI